MSNMRHIRQCVAPLFLLALLLLCTGCGINYVTPGRAADLATFGLNEQVRRSQTDPGVLRAMDRKPLATFPATLAVIRVQAADYRSYSMRRYRGHHHGGWDDRSDESKYTIITDREIETAEDFAALETMPLVTDVVAINRLLVPSVLQSDREVRAAAGAVHADLILLYTIDTRFETDHEIEPLGVLTLGLFPNVKAKVRTTASALLLDTRSGYIYAVAEASANREQLANAWTSDNAVDQSRKKTERQAFEKLITDFQRAWMGVVKQYATGIRTQDAPVWPVG